MVGHVGKREPTNIVYAQLAMKDSAAKVAVMLIQHRPTSFRFTFGPLSLLFMTWLEADAWLSKSRSMPGCILFISKLHLCFQRPYIATIVTRSIPRKLVSLVFVIIFSDKVNPSPPDERSRLLCRKYSHIPLADPLLYSHLLSKGLFRSHDIGKITSPGKSHIILHLISSYTKRSLDNIYISYKYL